MSNCPVCVPKEDIAHRTPSRVKFLRYMIYTSNLVPLMDDMYKKDPRPNLHVELGYSLLPDSPDRFYADDYDALVASIKNEAIVTPDD